MSLTTSSELPFDLEAPFQRRPLLLKFCICIFYRYLRIVLEYRYSLRACLQPCIERSVLVLGLLFPLSPPSSNSHCHHRQVCYSQLSSLPTWFLFDSIGCLAPQHQHHYRHHIIEWSPSADTLLASLVLPKRVPPFFWKWRGAQDLFSWRRWCHQSWWWHWIKSDDDVDEDGLTVKFLKSKSHQSFLT